MNRLGNENHLEVRQNYYEVGPNARKLGFGALVFGFIGWAVREIITYYKEKKNPPKKHENRKEINLGNGYSLITNDKKEY